MRCKVLHTVRVSPLRDHVGRVWQVHDVRFEAYGIRTDGTGVIDGLLQGLPGGVH